MSQNGPEHDTMGTSNRLFMFFLLSQDLLPFLYCLLQKVRRRAPYVLFQIRYPQIHVQSSCLSLVATENMIRREYMFAVLFQLENTNCYA
jgi:hypothetical protein